MASTDIPLHVRTPEVVHPRGLSGGPLDKPEKRHPFTVPTQSEGTNSGWKYQVPKVVNCPTRPWPGGRWWTQGMGCVDEQGLPEVGRPDRKVVTG